MRTCGDLTAVSMHYRLVLSLPQASERDGYLRHWVGVMPRFQYNGVLSIVLVDPF